MRKLTIQDLDLKGQKVLMRVDFNVPVKPDGTIADATRIREALPSIRQVLEKGGTAILMSHLGRPRRGKDPAFSLAPCAQHLAQLLGKPVKMAPNCIGPEVEACVAQLREGEVLLLENLRFHPGEENPSSDPHFAQQLARLGDLYVNDAFGTAHRAHSSTALIAQYFPGKAAAGVLMQKEIAFLSTLLHNPKRPFFAILGGAKISSKIGVLHALIQKVDGLFIGGAMALTFLAAQGISIGNTSLEENQIATAQQLLHLCATKKLSLGLPQDFLVADSLSEKAQCLVSSASQGIPAGFQGVDIGPDTVLQWASALRPAATVFWNGPLGICEIPSFATGTRKIAEVLSQLRATTIVGGGDSVAAITHMGLENRFTHLSTGGGACLEFLEQGSLPGIDALTDC